MNEKKKREKGKLQILSLLDPKKYNCCPPIPNGNNTFAVDCYTMGIQQVGQYQNVTPNGYTIRGIIWSPSASVDAIFWILEAKLLSGIQINGNINFRNNSPVSWTLTTLPNFLLPWKIKVSNIQGWDSIGEKENSPKARVYSGKLTIISNSTSTTNVQLQGSMVTSSISSTLDISSPSKLTQIQTISIPKKDCIVVPVWSGLSITTGGLFQNKFKSMDMGDELDLGLRFGPILIPATAGAVGILNKNYFGPQGGWPLIECVGMLDRMQLTIKMNDSNPDNQTQFMSLVSIFMSYDAATLTDPASRIKYVYSSAYNSGQTWEKTIDVIPIFKDPPPPWGQNIPSDAVWLGTFWALQGGTAMDYEVYGTILSRDFSNMKVVRFDYMNTQSQIHVSGNIMAQIRPLGSIRTLSGMEYTDIEREDWVSQEEIETEYRKNEKLCSFYAQDTIKNVEKEFEQ